MTSRFPRKFGDIRQTYPRRRRSPYRRHAERLAQAALRSPLGVLAVNPWWEGAGVWGIANLYMPLSRLWAAAQEAEGSADRFFSAVPLRPLPVGRHDTVIRMLQRFERRRRQGASAERVWDAAFFGQPSVDVELLASIEASRSIAAERFMLERLRFLKLLLRMTVPPVKFDVPSPAELAALHGKDLAEPGRVFDLPAALPPVTVSQAILSSYGRTYWIRFPSPSQRIGGMAWARVSEPYKSASAPSLIFGSGVCVDVDQWRVSPDPVLALVRAGIRVIVLEAPWHGRRTKPGSYGGEPFFATAPLGPIDLFSSMGREIATIIGWCRSQSSGPVAIGGASMGALTAALVLGHAERWPVALRPDAAVLLAFCGNLDELAFESALARAIGLPAALASKGWTRDSLRRFAPLTAAVERPCIPAERIIAVLGMADAVTPFAAGKRLIERWRLPERNRFIRHQGHFSVPVGLLRDDAPLQRLAVLLHGL